jgi:isocitrate dehydrogenase
VALKIITRAGSEKIIRYAFELAQREGRSKVTVATKANILKLTEGMFKRIGEELAPEYPGVTHDHLIIDNVAHQMAKNPAQFDVIVTTNLAGDIISDLASGLVGGLGFAASGNYGDGVAIFEAVHGSAPKYAGKNTINPTALILSSVMMLRHLGETDAAQRVEDAVYVTLEEGQAVTLDVARQQGDVEEAVSTTGYTDAIIANLGRSRSTRIGAARQAPEPVPAAPRRWSHGRTASGVVSTLVGVDVYVEDDGEVAPLGDALAVAARPGFTLGDIASRGTVVWPASLANPDNVGWWRCRFLAADGAAIDDAAISRLLDRISAVRSWVGVEKLMRHGSEEGFTRAQGQ